MKTTLLFLFACSSLFLCADLPRVPADIDHAPLDRLLQRYVDDKGLVDYKSWKESPEDVDALKTYLAAFAPAPETPAERDDLIASLINAYTAENWEAQMEARYRTWLAREDLNQFQPDHGRNGTAEISKIFDWYSEDYEGENTVEKVLSRFAPPEYREWLNEERFRIRHASYDWGLNDQGDTGDNYRHSILRSLF
ncbi:MAG: hypothetical protein WD708_12695 [Kiritimatiellia bacterium]